MAAEKMRKFMTRPLPLLSLVYVALTGWSLLATPSMAAAQTAKAPARSTAAPNLSPAEFAACLEGFWPEASSAGVTRAAFDAGLSGVTYDPRIVPQTGQQSEFSQAMWDYLASAGSPARITRGKAQASTYASVLEALERQYGVDKRIILAVWGMESNFGSSTGGTYVLRALTTLACARYRGDYFRDEVIKALKILQEGHIDRDEMLGSWAGAMGQTQFMPSSFVKYAVDYDGDGHKNIWTSIPDALASTANFLHKEGWTDGLPWGFEITLPKGFELARYGRSNPQSFSAWTSLGVARPGGEAMPARGEGALYLPIGIEGPAFLITSNFYVIKAYNFSDSYALGVGHLGDRIFGGAPIAAAWPKSQKRLSNAELKEVQERLTAMGYDVGKPDGRPGIKTSEALRDFQAKAGMVADGYATPLVLTRLKTRAH